MRRFAWTFRYFISLIWQTWLVWLMASISLLALLLAPQGQELLESYLSDSPFAAQTIFLFLCTLLAGGIFTWGSYLLLFFSELKGRLFGEERDYFELQDRINAWRYHDFVQEKRKWWINIYTGFWLFYPFWFCILAGFILKISNLACLVYALISFCWCLFWAWLRRSDTRGWVKKCIQYPFAKADLFLISIYKIFSKIWHYWFGFRTSESTLSIPAKTEVLSIYTEVPAQNLGQASAFWRGLSYVICLVSFALWFGLNRLSSEEEAQFGPAALLLSGLCIWTVVLLCLSFLNRKVLVPIFLILGLWIGLVSYFNSDHPIRKLEVEKEKANALSIEKSFQQWLESRPGFEKLGENGFKIGGQRYGKDRPFPYLVIAAEGGANRSAMWTALLLQELYKKYGATFDERIFAIGSVSGGSVGALSYSLARKAKGINLNEALWAFYSEDFLSSLTSSLFLKDLLHCIIPFYSPERDRAVAFERRIDENLEQHFRLKKGSELNFLTDAGNQFYTPLHLAMATEVESGKPAYLSNRPLSTSALPHAVSLNNAVEGIRWSGAMHFGARFPVFSPSASVAMANGGARRHYVDGGYFDNGAYQTLSDLIDQIQSSPIGAMVFPVFIGIGNTYENKEALISTLEDKPDGPHSAYGKGASWFNELQSVILTVVKVRSANTEMHLETLKNKFRTLHGCKKRFFYLDLRASGKVVPMNWFLSEKARMHILKSVKKVSKDFPDDLLADCETDKQPSPYSMNTPIQTKNDVSKSRKSIEENPVSAIQQANPPGPATHPGLYYYSKKQKKWKLKSEADFSLKDLKPLRNATKQKKQK